jgi:hypothetical protein
MFGGSARTSKVRTSGKRAIEERTFFLFDAFSKAMLKLAVTISPIFAKLSFPHMSSSSFDNFKTPPKHSNKVSDVAF